MHAFAFIQQRALYHVWRRNKLKAGITVALVFSALGMVAQKSDFDRQVPMGKLPKPKEPKQLFYLQRDPDENTVIYQLNMAGDTVDTEEPVNVYWIRYAEGGERKGLNFIQQTMAYGVSHKPLGNGDFELRLAAYKQLPLRLSYCRKSRAYRVFTRIDNREAILDRIFVRIRGGTKFSPDIAYFELSGRDAASLEPVAERIAP